MGTEAALGDKDGPDINTDELLSQEVAEYLRDKRKGADLTQCRLAEKGEQLGIRFDNSWVSKWERLGPRPGFLKALAYLKLIDADLDLMQENAARASSVMKLLSHPHRLMILCQLNQGEMSVGDLAELIGINQSPLSQHLARMRHEDVVQTRRDGQTVYYSLKDGEAARLIGALYEIFCEPAAVE